MSWVKNRPLKIVLCVQMVVTLVAAVVVWVLLDTQIMVSSLLGGLVSVISSAAFAVMISRHRGYTAGAAIRTALRAEAVKILLTVSLLWMVFKYYEGIHPIAFIGTFILTVMGYSMALLVSEDLNKDKINN